MHCIIIFLISSVSMNIVNLRQLTLLHDIVIYMMNRSSDDLYQIIKIEVCLFNFYGVNYSLKCDCLVVNIKLCVLIVHVMHIMGPPLETLHFSPSLSYGVIKGRTRTRCSEEAGPRSCRHQKNVRDENENILNYIIVLIIGPHQFY